MKDMTKTEKHITEGMGADVMGDLWTRAKVYGKATKTPYYYTVRSGICKKKSKRQIREEEIIFDELALIISWSVKIPVDQVKFDAIESAA